MNDKINNLTKKIDKDPDNAELYARRAKCYSNEKQYDKAVDDYSRAIELNPEYAEAYNSRGILYKNQKIYAKALEDYSKAIEIDPESSEPYNNRGLLYYNQKNYDKALADFNRALEIKPEYANAYNSRGILYKNQKDYAKALDDYSKCIELAPEYATAYRNRALLYSSTSDFDNALSDYLQAKEFYEKDKDISNVKFVENKIKEIQGILEGAKANNELQENLGAPSGGDAISILISKTASIENDVREMKKSFNDFLTEEAPEASDIQNISVFEVLRRWNSYTPIIANDHRVSKGGGYFYKVGECGIVIDPGFNFIDNFKSAGHVFNEINHVLITHAHNDHTTDLESILTLLHRYNENIIGDFDNPEEKTIVSQVINNLGRTPSEADRKQLEEQARELFLEDERRKRISIYMTVSSYKKYANMLSLYSKKDYDIIIINADDKLCFKYHGKKKVDDYADKLTIKAIYAKHDDLMSDHDSVGFYIEHDDFCLIYTGDTGFDRIVEKHYQDIKNNTGKEIILLAHLGGFKSREAEFDKSKNTEENKKAFYRNHLGRLGIAKLVEILAPKMCIISEFGEEFRNARLQLIKIYSELYKGTAFFASDINFAINAKHQIRAITSVKNIEDREFIEADDVKTCERKADYSLHYYHESLKETDIIEALVTKYFLNHS